jgi:hypothetical protein
MATYYWRGGVGTWNGSNTANWSTTSGGSGGAGPPTSTDDVIFDNASDAAGNFTVTCTTASAVCQDFTCTGPDVIITFSGGFSCHGNFSAANTANNVYTSCDVTLRATTTGKTFTSNARTIRSVTCNGAGGEWTMQDALTMGTLSGFTLTAGTWKTNNFNMTNGTWNISGTSTREIQLGSSTISIQGSTTATLNASTITNLTFTAGTSTINFTSNTSTLDSGGLTFYNVGYTATGSDTLFSINGANTFNNLTITGPSGTGQQSIQFNSNCTINGTLSVSGATAIRRVRVTTDDSDSVRTLTVNACSPSDTDFRGITITGTAAPLTGTRLGNLGGCSGITFTAAADKYWNLAGSQSWTSTGWALTDTGSPALNNFPLAQDDVFFTNAGAAGTVSVTTGPWACNNLDLSDRTSAATLTITNQDLIVKGDLTIGTGMTIGGTGARISMWNLDGANRTITTNAVSINANFDFNSAGGGKVTFADDVTTTRSTTLFSSGHLHPRGILDLNGKTWKTNSPYNLDYTTVRELRWGNNAVIEFTSNGSDLINLPSATNFTQVLGTGNKVVCSANTSSVRTFSFPSTWGDSDVVDFEVTAGTGSVSGGHFKNVNLQGYVGSASSAGFSSFDINGNLTTGTTYAPAANANTGAIFFLGANNSTASFGTVTHRNQFLINKTAGSSLTLTSDLTTASTFFVRTGTFDSDNYAISCEKFDVDQTGTKVINLGTSTITLTGNTLAVFEYEATGTTFNASSCTWIISSTTNDSRTFGSSSTTIPNVGTVRIGGGSSTGEIRLYGNMTVGNIETTRTGAWPLQLLAGNTVTFDNFSLSGTAGNLITLRSSSSVTKANVVKNGGNVCVDYLFVSDIAGTPANRWYVGANSTDNGDNTGLIFTACPAAGTGNFFQLFFP